MAMRTNPLFNDPTIGAAFANLAAAFAPPSGSDVAGYANAAYTRTKSQALSEALNRLRDPALSADQRDLAGAIGQLWNPNQGFAARDMADVTSRRGQDLDLQAKTYATDVNARTLAESNAADNRRALATNEADNKRLVDVAMLGPVAAGATRFVPPQLQARYGVPAQQVGTLSANEGETVIAPDGRTVSGQPKLPTEEQVRGAILRDLRGNGELTDRNLADVIMGKETPVAAIDPATGAARFMSPGEAVRTGAKPAADVTKQGEAAGKIRGEIAQLPSYKNYAQAQPIYANLLGTADRNSKASDLNIVYSIGKLFDPGSVVREGEQIAVKNTAALPDWLQGAIAQLNGGSALTPETRAALLAEAHTRMSAYEDALGADLDRYGGIVDRAGLSRADVLPRLERSKPFELPQKPETGRTGTPTAPAPTAAPVKVATPAEAMKLPPGTPITLPDGSHGVVPQRPQAQPASRAAGASGGW